MLKSIFKLTVSDSRFFPLVTKVNPWVSIATPVRWTCSSIYLKRKFYVKSNCDFKELVHIIEKTNCKQIRYNNVNKLLASSTSR